MSETKIVASAAIFAGARAIKSHGVTIGVRFALALPCIRAVTSLSYAQPYSDVDLGLTRDIDARRLSGDGRFSRLGRLLALVYDKRLLKELMSGSRKTSPNSRTSLRAPVWATETGRTRQLSSGMNGVCRYVS